MNASAPGPNTVHPPETRPERLLPGQWRIAATGDFPDLALYVEVFRRDGWFSPLASVAERVPFTSCWTN